MPSRKLTKAEAAVADAILDRVKVDITQAASDDPVLLFALRRRTHIRLMYWERKTPAERSEIQVAKYAEQNGICALCDRPMDLKGSEMDRTDPVPGYEPENVRLVHHPCRVEDQQRRDLLSPCTTTANAGNLEDRRSSRSGPLWMSEAYGSICLGPGCINPGSAQKLSIRAWPLPTPRWAELLHLFNDALLEAG